MARGGRVTFGDGS
jgi:hypothetical protein